MPPLHQSASLLCLLLAVSLLQAEPPRLQVEHKSTVTCLAWSHDGKSIVTGTQDGQVRVIETATGKELHAFGTGGPLTAIALSPDGKTLAVSQTTLTISAWDVATGKKKMGSNINTYRPEHLAFRTDGQAVVGVGPGEMINWTLTGGMSGSKMAKPPAGGGAGVAPDGSMSGWCDANGVVRLRQWTPSKASTLQVGQARSIAFGPDAKVLAVGGADNKVQLWDLNTKQKTISLDGLQQPATKLALSADGKTLAGATADGATIRVWDLERNRPRRDIQHNRGAVNKMALSPDGKWLATTSQNGQTLFVWNVATRENPHQGPPLNLNDKELAALWSELSHADFAKSNHAWTKLAAAGDNAVPFLQQQIRPIAVPPVDKKKLEMLLVDLDSDRFVVRERATKELTEMGELAVAPLQRLVEKSPSDEARRRAESVLKRLAQPGLTPDRLRVLESIELLELSKTAKAIALLEEIERDTLIAQIRTEARRALIRVTGARDKKE